MIRIKSRPGAERNLGSTTTGLRRTGLETDRDGFLYVPESYDPVNGAPLLVMLHGAGGDAHHSIGPMRDLADHTGTVLLAPESQDVTWDGLMGDVRKDVHFIDEALSDIFALYKIDRKHIAIGGFSDGASYALSVGTTNGDLFTHIIAFSPGFFPPSVIHGKPAVFISHGTSDEVLPVETCSRVIVPKLRNSGLDVTYEEFSGGHTIPTAIGRRSFGWFLGSNALPEIKEAVVPSTESGIELT